MEQLKVKKRSFFTRPLVILVLLAAAFWLGNAVGTGKLQASGPKSEFKSVSGLPENLNYNEVEGLYDTLRDNYDGKLTQQQVMDGLKKGLASSTGDPYTEYYTAKKATEFTEQLNNSFSGIGAELGKDKDSNIIIVAPIAGFPADKAGLKSQDIITDINDTSTTGMSIEDAVSKIRGEKGTKVTLKVIRNRAEALSFTITRDTIKIESVKTEQLDGNIGYISISSFAEDTDDLIAKAAQDMKSKQVKGIILDLRGNPGGLLDASVTVSSQWLPSGKTVLQEKRGGKTVVQTYTSDGPATLEGIPTVVLINEGSASASEITAGALRDNNAAHIIGTKSYGKGVVQQTLCVSGTRQGNGGCSADMLKVTVASWYRPNGQNINKEGIKPDQEVKVLPADVQAGKDAQKDAAITYLKAKQ
ncbi:MAG TPA: S41 family peptidase [Candidatus Saccharimonadales bacterium]|jgi:carboxyl-terminal processing protease